VGEESSVGDFAGKEAKESPRGRKKLMGGVRLVEKSHD